jgi:hypothetical protein
MSTTFPSPEFFDSLQKSMAADPGCTEHLDPSEAYCGFSIDDRLYVFEFDGRTCAGSMRGGNELDLDFIVAGPRAVWQQALDAIEDGAETEATLPSLYARGALEIRSQDDAGSELGKATLPFLQVFLEQARGLSIVFDPAAS